MILKPAGAICENVSRYDTYYFYPVTYYVRPDTVNPVVSDVPLQDGVRFDAYCVNLGDMKLVVHSIAETDIAIVEALDRDGNQVEPVTALDLAYNYLTSRTARSFTPHEIRALSLLFMVDESDVSKMLKYNKLVSMLEDRFVAIVGESVYVFSRNPEVVFLKIEDPDAVAVAREKSIVSKAPIRDMREHVKSFMSGNSITVFVDSRVSLWCDHEKCIVVRTPSNVTRLMLRDIDLYAVEVDVSSPRRYRDVNLVLPSDYIVISKNVLLLNKSNSKMKVAGAIANVGFSTTTPLLFSKSGFVGFAHVVILKEVARVKVVKSITRTRAEQDVEEAENLTAAL